MAAAIAGAVIGTIGLISGFLGSKKASKAAKEQAAEEARINQATTAERLRLLDKEERALYGQTLAGYASGGVLGIAPSLQQPQAMTGSPSTILKEQATEFAAEKAITREVGASNVAQALQRGKATAEAYKWQGYSNAASGISNILTSYALTK
jgi:hypothetical protein